MKSRLLERVTALENLHDGDIKLQHDHQIRDASAEKISALNYKGRQHLTTVRSLDTLDTSAKKIGISTEKNGAIGLRRDHDTSTH